MLYFRRESLAKRALILRRYVELFFPRRACVAVFRFACPALAIPVPVQMPQPDETERVRTYEPRIAECSNTLREAHVSPFVSATPETTMNKILIVAAVVLGMTAVATPVVAKEKHHRSDRYKSKDHHRRSHVAPARHYSNFYRPGHKNEHVRSSHHHNRTSHIIKDLFGGHF